MSTNNKQEVTMITDLTTQADVNAMLEFSKEKPIMLLKHSTRCPVSSYAWAEFKQFAENANTSCYRVLVVEDRHLSLHLSQLSGVRHQSPQAILFFQKQAIWHASHYDINQSSLKTAFENLPK